MPGQRPGACAPALQPQQPDERLGVGEFAARRKRVELVGACRQDFDEFTCIEMLGAALEGVLTTPLGLVDDPGADDLWSIQRTDRLSEMDFELPLADVDGGFGLAAVAELMRRHLSGDDPLRPYADEVAGVSDERFHGFLTGSIDSVLRVNSPGGPRFVVVDYKTNRLGPEELTLDHYLPSAMAEEMIRTHYPLQAVLYCVALHRFLAARLAGYDPGRHLGGVGYLFVRGMGGREAGDGTGVFGWFPPAGLVSALSDLLADRSRP